jgi:cytochrome c556
MSSLLHKKLFSTRTFLFSSLLLLQLPASAQQDLVDERQQGFKDMGAAMKTLRDELKGGKPDYASVAAAAEQLSTLSAKIPAWFPAGSGPAAGLETDAREYIWENKAKFDSITQQFITESGELVALAKSEDAKGLQQKLGAIRDNCSACHDSFRVD